jgi:GcrA cell cycle regulator
MCRCRALDDETRRKSTVEPATWAPAHCAALTTYAAKNLSYSEIADAINLKFGTNYSRSAVLGRARRMGLCDTSPAPASPRGPASPVSAVSATLSRAEQRTPRLVLRVPDFARTEAGPVRCAEVNPRHVALIDLGRGDCRYPYGGDAEGEPITFCGRPRRKGSSYCAAHFRLTRNPDIETEPPATRTKLRLAAAV